MAILIGESNSQSNRRRGSASIKGALSYFFREVQIMAKTITSEQRTALNAQIRKANARIEAERQRQLHGGRGVKTKTGATALEFALKEVESVGGITQLPRAQADMSVTDYKRLKESTERVLRSEQLTVTGRRKIFDKALATTGKGMTRTEKTLLGDVFNSNMWAKVREVAGLGSSESEVATLKALIETGKATRAGIIQIMSRYLKNQDELTLTDVANEWAERRGLDLDEYRDEN